MKITPPSASLQFASVKRVYIWEYRNLVEGYLDSPAVRKIVNLFARYNNRWLSPSDFYRHGIHTTIAYYLKAMADAGFLESKSENRRIYYRFKDKYVPLIRKLYEKWREIEALAEGEGMDDESK